MRRAYHLGRWSFTFWGSTDRLPRPAAEPWYFYRKRGERTHFWSFGRRRGLEVRWLAPPRRF